MNNTGDTMKITFTSPFSFTVDNQEYLGRPEVTYQDTLEEKPYDPLGEDDWWDLCWDTFHIMIGANTGKVWFRCDKTGGDITPEEVENPHWLEFFKKTFRKNLTNPSK